MTLDLTTLLERREVLIGALAVGVLLLVWAAWRIRKIARSERPDEPLSNLAMISGFGWSSEAVWVLTGPTGADLVTPIRIFLFAIFETIMVVFMIRAKRNVRILGYPGRAGRNVWLVATGMSLVAVWTAHNPGEALLRLLVPILLTAMFWDGLVGEGVRKLEGLSSWRWTPRRFLLWIRAIEPGERDVETVNRERLTQQMTKLEFLRRHGSKRLTERRTARLARLSLTADDEVIHEVRRRVDRATWFEPTQAGQIAIAAALAVPVRRALAEKRQKVRHHSLVRKVRVAHPRPVIIAAQEQRQDPRASHEIDMVVRAIKDQHPKLPQRRIAALAATSDSTVRRALRRTEATFPGAVNGRKPELEVASR